MNKTFYRKYRPQCFKDVIGQDFIKRTLSNSIINNKLSHAYIFSGPRGTGKTSIAKIFSKAINCLNNKDGDCCNECENCKLIINNQSFDIIELDAASNNGVGEIRSIIDSTSFLPSKLKKKVYIIDESHMLTNSAWNALLKTIEDPPAHIIFIFATTEPGKIIPTIISRCERYNFSKIDDNHIENLISKIAKKEGITIDDEAMRLISLLSEGSVRDSLSILSQLSSYSNNINEDVVNNIFGLVNVKRKIEYIKNIISKNISSCLKMIDEFYNEGADFYRLTYQIIQIILDVYIFRKTKSIDILSILSETNVNSINISTNESVKMISIFEKCLSDIKSNGNEKFYFELATVNAMSLFEFQVPNKNDVTHQEVVYEKSIDEIIEEEKEIDEILKEKNIGIKEESNIDDDQMMNNVRLEDILTNRNLKQENKTTTEKIEANSTEERIVDKNVSNEIQQNKNDITSFVKFQTNEKKLNKINEDNLINYEKIFSYHEINQNDLPRQIIKDKKQLEIKNQEPKKKIKISSVIENANLFASMPSSKKEDFIKEENIIKQDNFKIKEENKNIEDNIKKPIEVHEPKIIKEELEEKPKEIKRPKEETSNISGSSNELEETFLKIADNRDDQTREELTTIFNTIKGNIPKTPQEGYIIDANKILLASRNGFIFLFDNKLSSKNLNLVNKDKDFLEYIKNKFKNIYYVIGVSKEEVKVFGEHFKKLKQQQKKLDDISKEELLEKFNDDISAKNIAMELFKDELE